MPLIGNIVNTFIPGANGNGNSWTAPGQNKPAEDPAVTSGETTGTGGSTGTTDTDTSTQTTSGTAGGTREAVYFSAQTTSSPTRAMVDGPEADARDDKVIAVDFARRAAIATQAKMKNETLLEDMVAEPFAPLTDLRANADAAYATADAAPKAAPDKVELKV